MARSRPVVVELVVVLGQLEVVDLVVGLVAVRWRLVELVVSV